MTDASMISKQLALSLLAVSGAFQLGEMLSSRNLLVLTYHRVVPRERCPDGNRPPNTHFCDEFDRQMAFVARRFYAPSGEELRGYIEGRTSLPRYSIAITFDDGYENNFVYALPILQRYGLHGVFFVTTGLVGTVDQMFWFDRLDRLLSVMPRDELLDRLRRIDPHISEVPSMRPHRYFKKLPYDRQCVLLDALEQQLGDRTLPPLDRTVYGVMSWDQVRSMAAAGMTIGSHTDNHQILAAVSPEDARAEMQASRLRIEEEIGQRCWCFAYPNGECEDFRPQDQRSAEEAGYLCAFTQISGTINRQTSRYALPRVAIPETNDMRVFRSYVSGVRRALSGVFPVRMG
jgi:peptidoglycan/xylan/chitin deacetylase (PgdA/CDA1 family)